MAGGFADNPASFLGGDTRVVHRRALDSLSVLSATSLESLANAATSELTESFTHTSSAQNAAEQTASVADSEAFAAMCAIITTLARDGGARTLAEQRQQLYALGVEDEDLQAKLLPLLVTSVPCVERVLESAGFDFAHVVEVSWRLDYVLRSSSAGNIHEPLCFVQMKLQTPRASDAELQTVVISCSVEELRSLVYQIQEAANEVEKLVAGTPSQLRSST